MRLFVAINLPDAEKSALTHELAALPATDLPVKWVDSDALHITMKFLGEVTEARLPVLVAALDAACAGVTAFEVIISGFGAFPSLARPDLFWVGVQSGPQLGELHGRIDAALLPLGFRAEERAFRPHITVARLRKDGRVRERARLERMRETFDYTGTFRATSVDLMQSRLGRDRARYESLHRMGLR